MIRSKYLAIAALALSFGALTACDSTSSDSSISISGNPRLDNATLPADGSTKTAIRGTIADDAAGMVVSLSVQDASGSDVTSNFTISTTAITSSSKSWSLGDPAEGNSTIGAKSGIANGNYTLVITATSGSSTATAKVAFTVTAGTSVTGTATKEYTNGVVYNYLSKYKGAWSLSGDSAVSASAASTYKDLQDLVATDNSVVFDGSLTSPNGATFVKANSFSYATATGGASGTIATAFANGTVSSTISAPAVGDIYLVKLSGGTFVALKVTAVTPGSATFGDNSGSISFSYRI